MDGHEELVFAIEGAAYYNDTFWININRSGPLDELGAGAVDRFWRWAERFADVLRIDSKGPVVLTAPEWGY
jgi:hypothetical protein